MRVLQAPSGNLHSIPSVYTVLTLVLVGSFSESSTGCGLPIVLVLQLFLLKRCGRTLRPYSRSIGLQWQSPRRKWYLPDIKQYLEGAHRDVQEWPSRKLMPFTTIETNHKSKFKLPFRILTDKFSKLGKMSNVVFFYCVVDGTPLSRNLCRNQLL